MPTYEIANLDHSILEPFRELRSRNWTQQSGIFVAEGPLLLEAIVKSRYRLHSILLDRKYHDRFRSRIPDNVDVAIVEHDMIANLVGYQFHRGVISCGYRQPINTIDDSFERPSAVETLVGIVGIQDPENVGAVLRSCAGLGIRRVLLGPGTADPLGRRALRVSMGTTLELELFRMESGVEDLQNLRRNFGIETVAASLAKEAEPLESVCRKKVSILLFGNERNGLPRELMAEVDRHVCVPMESNIDSLNVSVAAGIIIHYFTRLAAIGG